MINTRSINLRSNPSSSATNIGADKDSLKRQKEAVANYAKSNKIEIVRKFYDAAVSGADPIDAREGFSDLLAYMSGNGARMILCENASRFARDLTVQLTGHSKLMDLGYELIPVDAPTHFTDDTPTAQMVRSILGAVSEFEKSSLLAKLKAASVRRRKETGRCEGRKPLVETKPGVGGSSPSTPASYRIAPGSSPRGCFCVQIFLPTFFIE